MTLDEARDSTGETVVYSSHPGQADEGVIKYVRGRYAFVSYGPSRPPVATDPEYLTLARRGSFKRHLALNLAEAGLPVVTSCAYCLRDIAPEDGRWRLAGGSDDPWTCEGAAGGRHEP